MSREIDYDEFLIMLETFEDIEDIEDKDDIIFNLYVNMVDDFNNKIRNKKFPKYLIFHSDILEEEIKLNTVEMQNEYLDFLKNHFIHSGFESLDVTEKQKIGELGNIEYIRMYMNIKN